MPFRMWWIRGISARSPSIPETRQKREVHHILKTLGESRDQAYVHMMARSSSTRALQRAVPQ